MKKILFLLLFIPLIGLSQSDKPLKTSKLMFNDGTFMTTALDVDTTDVCYKITNDSIRIANDSIRLIDLKARVVNDSIRLVNAKARITADSLLLVAEKTNRINADTGKVNTTGGDKMYGNYYINGKTTFSDSISILNNLLRGTIWMSADTFYIGRGCTKPIKIGNTSLIVLPNGDVMVTGGFSYDFRHAFGSADSVVGYSIGGVLNRFYKINPTGFVWREKDGINGVGDSCQILREGDYTIHCWLGASTTTSADKIRIKMYVNGIPSPTSLGRWIINSDNSTNVETKYYMWYKVALTVNSWISIWVTDLSNNRSVNITDFKLYIEEKPEN